uniref:Fibrohexamerin n=1 Tax=Galleria mellonella TaxID=7137 RepID=SI25_GALME|nr:RecName: Full=Fibrohexamerin; AltName: Full=25 kDa silk glycoprotein; AltName: Full=p25; Flags: Precursor [Galleria mellonella]AAC17486.1 P25 [Galleria mellonella]AAC38994.1 low molecular weight silk protein [Galleria mellonella]
MLKFIIFALTVALCEAGPANNVVRPCRLDDLKCIRDNISANSNCNANVRGSIPSEYVIPRFNFETPFFNASYIDNNLIIRNNDACRVSEFFFNVKADTSVLAVDCPNLDLESDRTLIQHASLQEETTYNYHIRGIYPLIRLTTNLLNADRLNLCNAFTYADVTALPIFKIDPKDRPTANFLSRDLSLLNIYERETFAYRPPQLIRQFVNSLICDFGCQ